MAEYGLQASEGVHLGREHHHEQVGSELGPGYTQNGAKSGDASASSSESP